MKFFGNKLAIIFILLLGVVFYSLTIRGTTGNPQPDTIRATLEGETKPFELSPERGRFAHIMALAENHTYALSQQLAEFVYPDVGYWKGKFYSFFAPGLSYMALPFYLIGRHFNLSQVGSFAFVSLMSILAMIFIFKISREIFRMPIWASLLAVMIFAFGSTAWSYAITLYQHHLTVFFMLSGFYAVWRYKQQTKFSWVWGLWVWAAYSLAISIDYPNAILLLPVMVYFLVSSLSFQKLAEGIKFSFRPAIVLTMIVFVAITGLQLYQAHHYLGSWTQLYGGIPGYQGSVTQGLNQSPNEQTLAQSENSKNVVGFFKEVNFPRGLMVLTVSFERGIFFFGPIFLLALLGIYLAVKKVDTEKGFLIGLVATNLFLYSSWGDPWGGWAYGTRYLIPSMSILAIFCAYWVSQGQLIWWKKLVAFLLFAFSSAVALLGALTTNAIPPKSEAIPLHTGYNFLRNWTYFTKGQTGSFLYQTYFSGKISLMAYALDIYALILVIALFVMFILPRFHYDD